MTDVDGLHGSFLATDENGERLFAITSSDGAAQHAALSIVHLASVPLGIGSVSPLTASASGGNHCDPSRERLSECHCGFHQWEAGKRLLQECQHAYGCHSESYTRPAMHHDY
jgi:hypothetical protein